jgi:nitroimidazol reductase NimA-like FMN-containing flavoprotein (pyridoxamine 5'-phosphate oxidase superfamily)
LPNDYDISKRNKIRQVANKAAYDKATVHSVLDSALMAHVGFVQDGEPVVVPMLYGREGETLFLHGARKARIIRLLEGTTSVCINITHLDALVFARSAFNSSMNFRSVTVFGAPRLIDDEAEKLHALQVISECTMPGRWAELRAPYEKELKMTGVIAVEIETASAKLSAKENPEDEPEDYDSRVWAGILPIHSVFSAPISDARLGKGIEPSDTINQLVGKRL